MPGPSILVGWSKIPSEGVRRRLVLALLALYLLLFAIQLPKFEFWGRFVTIDEQLQYYQVARNFDRYGFPTHALLPDLSTGSSPSQHPYLYNHQPPGPQLLIALILRVFGERFALVRAVLAAIFAAGIFSFLAFARVLARQGIRGVEAALLVVPPDLMLHSIDHPAYCAFPLFTFLPMVALDQHRRTGRARWLLAAAVLVFVASNYLIYGPLFMTFVLWGLGAWLGLVPVGGRPLAVVGCAAALAIGAHLLQTPVALGWPVFARELWITVSNRMSGRPTREEVAAFYRSVHLVLYGGHVFSVRHFGRAVYDAFSFPGRGVWTVSFAGAVVVGLVQSARWLSSERVLVVSPETRDVIRRLATLILWIGAAILMPFAMFPAFSSDYGPKGTNEFLLGILVVGAIGMAGQFEQRLVRVLLVISVVGIAVPQAREVARTTLRVANWIARPSAEAVFLDVANGLRGEIVMTNVDPVVAGFFTQEVALGGCHLGSVSRAGVAPEACQVYFIRGFPDETKLRPVAFVWVGKDRSGNPFCTLLDCIEPDDLASLYDVRFASPLVKVFDLTRPSLSRSSASARRWAKQPRRDGLR